MLTNTFIDRPAAPVADRPRAWLHGTGVPAVRLLGSVVGVPGGALPAAAAMAALPAEVLVDQCAAKHGSAPFATAQLATAQFATVLITTPGTTLGNHPPGRPQS